MRKITFLALAIFTGLGMSSLAHGQAKDLPHTPVKGSPERQAIMDALRANFKLDTGTPVIFQVHYLKVHNGWAWVDVTPLGENNKPVAEGGTSLLHYEKDKWTVIDLSTVPADPSDPLGDQDASPGFIRNLRQKYPAVPEDIFPKRRK